MTGAIGIDLGTTYTVVAVIEEGRPRIIPNAEGQRLTPSVVAFTRDGRLLVGQPAKRQATVNPQRTVCSIKRRMGSDYKVRLGEREYTPQEISSFILRKVKADAENYLGQKIDKAVITVPAYFNDRQRQATREAGIMAGLDVIRIINEPTAAALAYGLDREDIHTVLVWDLGGGTFDVSLLDLGEGIFEVRAVSGDTWLGGDDFDRRLADYLAEQYHQTCGIAFPQDGVARHRLRKSAEKAKIALSQSTSTRVYIPFNGGDSETPRHLETTLTRDRLQQLTQDLLQRMVPPTRQALADARLEARDIDRMILVGGATRMPAVWDLARQVIGKEPYQSLNPDEVVAMGAAIQAGMLLGTVNKVVLLDVLPLSLGLETQGGIFTRIIPRNTPLPALESRIFTTAADNQTSVDIHVLQGERALALDNISLGLFQLQDIPPLPRGAPKIEVSFEADVDGIVHVSATDLLTGNEIRVKIVSSKSLRPYDIERLVAEARSFADKDRERRHRVAAAIQAENAVAGAEMALEKLGDSGLEAQTQEIERTVLRVRQALAVGQSDEIAWHSEKLRELLGAAHTGPDMAQKGEPD